jgi:hypothetical protein
MTISLEQMKTVPAYFHLLTLDQLAEVIEEAREVIFNDTDTQDVKNRAGARLFYARINHTAMIELRGNKS